METGKINSVEARPLQRLISQNDGGGQGQSEKLGLMFPLWLWPEDKERITVAKRDSPLTFTSLNSHSNNCKIKTDDRS